MGTKRGRRWKPRLPQSQRAWRRSFLSDAVRSLDVCFRIKQHSHALALLFRDTAQGHRHVDFDGNCDGFEAYMTDCDRAQCVHFTCNTQMEPELQCSSLTAVFAERGR